MTREPILSLRHVSKAFGKIVAVRDVDVDIYPGEVVGLIGDNGAGKSTVVHMMAGVHRPDRGRIEVAGRPVKFASPSHARDRGVETVFQNLGLVDCLSVWRNFFLGRELRKGPFMDAHKMQQEAVRALQDVGLVNLRNVNGQVSGLSGGERQALSIGRAVYFERKVLILDEPASALSAVETDRVFGYIRSAKESGLGVVVVLHNMQQCRMISDRFVVLARGRKILDAPNTGQSEELLRGLL
jgi:simple sugar transport system ATP-binding protein